MSKARFDKTTQTRGDARRALDCLKEAQAIVDTLDRPDIGARLQEVIEVVEELGEGNAA